MVFHGAFHTRHADLTGFKIVDTGKAFDQSRFTGAVFAHQGMDLAFSQSKIHIVKRLYAGECHAYPAHSQCNIVLQVYHLTPGAVCTG